MFRRMLTRLLGGAVVAAPIAAPEASMALDMETAVGAIDRDPLSQIAILIAIAYLIWSFVAVRKLSRDAKKARDRVSEVEGQLNDSESALAAEPMILMVWRGREDAADRIVGGMRGAARVPTDAAGIENFAAWLDKESATQGITVSEGLASSSS